MRGIKTVEADKKAEAAAVEDSDARQEALEHAKTKRIGYEWTPIFVMTVRSLFATICLGFFVWNMYKASTVQRDQVTYPEGASLEDIRLILLEQKTSISTYQASMAGSLGIFAGVFVVATLIGQCAQADKLHKGVTKLGQIEVPEGMDMDDPESMAALMSNMQAEANK